MSRIRTEEYKQYQKEWRAKNKDKLNAAYRRHKEKNPEARMHNAARCRAQKAGIPFDIAVSDIIYPELCPYLKIPLLENSPSLDRINPEHGYVKGNIQVISNKANMMKSNATLEELVTFAQSVLERHN